jgi:hypothetical protein
LRIITDKAVKRPKKARAAARDSFPFLPAFRSKYAKFIVKVNKKFTITKLLQEKRKSNQKVKRIYTHTGARFNSRMMGGGFRSWFIR